MNDLVVSVVKDLRRATGSGLPARKRLQREMGQRAQVRYADALIGSQWQALRSAGRRSIHDRHEDLTGLLLRQQALASVMTRMPATRAQVARVGKSLEGLSDKVVVRGKRGGPALTAAERAVLTEADPRDWRRRQRALDGVLARAVTELERDFAGLTAAYMGGVLAANVARLNRPHPRTSSSAIATKLAASVITGTLDLEQALRDALVSGHSEDIRRTGVALASQNPHKNLALLVDHAAAVAVKRRTSPDRENLDDAAVELAEAIRLVLRGVALGRTAHWVAGWPVEAPVRAEWAAAAVLPFGAPRSSARRVALASLARTPDRFDGSEVRIAGTVSSIRNAHRRRKVISTATVSAGDREITVVLPYIKLDSGGMVPGSAVRASGVWSATNKETAGPALQVDRLPLGELARVSWSPWVDHQLGSMFVRVPHGLDLQWSWEPGSNGAGNQLRYGTWAEAS